MTPLPVLLTPGRAALCRSAGYGLRGLLGGNTLAVVLAAFCFSILAGEARAEASAAGLLGVLAL